MRIAPGCVLMLLSLAAHCCAAEPLWLAKDGVSQYRVIIAENARQPIPAVAEDFVDHFEKITGVQLPIITDAQPMMRHEILIGPSRHLDELLGPIDTDALSQEACVIQTRSDPSTGRHLMLFGGPVRGTVNAVYTFLEDHLGCRWFTPELSVVRRQPKLTLPKLDIHYTPPFEARFVNSRSTGDPAWAARQRLNLFSTHMAHYRLAAPVEEESDKHWHAFVADPRLKGVWHYAGNQVHTLAHGNLLPVEKYDDHPQYFALWEGKRRMRGNPCFTNPELFQFIMQRVRQRIMKYPHGRITGISHGDGTRVCQCATCQAAYEHGPSGSTGELMRYVNRVAAELEKDHPDILIDTLGYGWTQTPPTGIQMHRNVVVRYCPLWSCSYHPFNAPWDDVTGTGCWRNVRHRTYAKLQEWLAMSPRVWVWHYSLGLANLYPFPNLWTQSPNFKAMRDAGVTGVYVMTTSNFQREPQRAGLAELKTYIFAKLAWDPDFDVSRGVNEFAQASYGPAAKHVLSYIDRINDSDSYSYTARSMRERCTNTWGRNATMGPTPGFHLPHVADFPLRPAAIVELNALLDDAEKAAADDPAALARLKLLRMSLQFAILRHGEKTDPIYIRAWEGFFETAEKEDVPIPPQLLQLQ
jgi:hypothetical protein